MTENRSIRQKCPFFLKKKTSTFYFDLFFCTHPGHTHTTIHTLAHILHSQKCEVTFICLSFVSFFNWMEVGAWQKSGLKLEWWKSVPLIWSMTSMIRYYCGHLGLRRGIWKIWSSHPLRLAWINKTLNQRWFLSRFKYEILNDFQSHDIS